MAVLLAHPQFVGSPLGSPPPAMASASNTAPPSPTSSMFSESTSLLDEIRHWDESKVAEWLRSVNCGKYAQLFEENHINGEALLEVDQNVVKEMGITKVGDRVRLFVAIKALRNKCYATARKNKSPLTQQDQASISPFVSQQTIHSPVFSNARPESPIDPSYSQGSTWHSQSPSFPPSSQPSTSMAKHGLTPVPSNPTSRSVSQTSLTATLQPSEALKNNMVKFIFQQGHTKSVDISGCFNAESIIKKGIRKFGSKDQALNWTVYVTTDTGSARKVEDIEIVAICHTPERLERERLILVRAGQVPSTDEYQKSIQIAREQLAREVPQRPGTFIEGTGDRTSTLPLSNGGSQPTPQLPPPPRRNHGDESGHGSNRKTMRNFFGQRPPSELISSNLAEYFPGHESRVLEQTVRNSMRRSKRISGLSKRISIATTASYSSSNRESLPPVPTVGETWLNAGTAQQPVQQQNTGGSSRKSLLTSSPPSRTSSTFRRIGGHRSTNSGTSSILADDDSDIRTSPIEGVPVDEEDLDPRRIDSLSTSRPFSLHSRAETISSVLSDNNSYIEVDNVEDIPEELSDAEYDANEIDGGPTRWIKGALIGSGSFGSVLLGLNALTGELMAVKQVEVTKTDKHGDPVRKKAMIDALQREIQLLRDLHHENIVQYLGSNSDGQYLNIFLEYVPGGSVAALLNNYGPFEEPLIRTFVRQILCGLSYLHGKDIIHRDIKGANVLVDNKGKIKISDFGISKRVEAGLLSNNQHHRPSLQGSVYWMAPEVVKQTSYTKKADIWSLGCLIVEMFTGTHPFPEFSQMQALFKIGTLCAPEIPKESTNEANEFLSRTFEFDYEKRPMAQELLLHPFLSPIVSGRSGASVSQGGGALVEGLAAASQFVK
ncbi:kinase-like domain-containing protein [Lipomyces kononenkoae]|uniref:Kinase-like domain-containing protein n=1 Tax=Lipomyces kononenkoae TaxID=34357 RepID=A0ACC3T2Y3_LIPKO